MSWIQVYVTGLSRSVDPSDEEIESSFAKRYNLEAGNSDVLWAGEGTSLIKRDQITGACRGYIFLAFYSMKSASAVVDRINNYQEDIHGNSSDLPPILRAELRDPIKSKKKKEKKKEQYQPDLRLRRQRGAPTGKHPVITSSSGKRTNLGSKTR